MRKLPKGFSLSTFSRHVKHLPIILLLLLFLSGCTGTYSTAEQDHRIYAVTTREQVQAITENSVKRCVEPRFIRDGESQALSSGVRVQRLFFSTNIQATAIALKGTNQAGKMRDGYGFLVTYWGNMPFPQTPGKIYHRMEEEAAKGGETLTLSKEEWKKSRLNMNYLRILRP
ncbi:MAG: hypothetical protein ABI615_11885 [Chthoniobacterales bacterium]